MTGNRGFGRNYLVVVQWLRGCCMLYGSGATSCGGVSGSIPGGNFI